jgi:tetratricopeptide (TPR) repeat protein
MLKRTIMKSKQILLLTLLTVSVIAISGCKKYLELKSDSRLLIPSTLTDIQGILDDATQMNVNRTPSYGEASAGDFFLLPSAIEASPEIRRAAYVWERPVYRYPNDWSTSYLPVYNSNLCLEMLEKIPRDAGNAKAWDNVRGSALFFRSYYFFMLTMQFGKAYDPASSSADPGIVLRLSSDFNVVSKRASVAECLQRAIADALESVALLPDYPQVYFRPSKAAAYGQLARIYIYMRDYHSALRYADDCLKLNSSLINYNNDTDILGLDLAVPFRKFNKETIFYSEMGPGFFIQGPSTARIDSNLYGSYEVNDLRRRAYFRANGGYQQFKGSYSSSASTLFSGLATDEMYLTRSECRAMNDDLSGAMADLNMLLRSRYRTVPAFVPLVAVSRADALVKIRRERRKELLMRSLRWPDLKRYNLEGEGIVLERKLGGRTYQLMPNSAAYVLTIPQDIIEQAGIEQN